MRPHCPACLHAVTSATFLEQQQVPVQSVRLVESGQQALDFPRGNISLVRCESCGHVFNRDFEPATQQWDGSYEETQACSAHFSSFSARLADELVERWNLEDKSILEAGCGKGHFLAELCRDGRNQGLGIDPAFVAQRRPAGSRTVRYISDVLQSEHLEFHPDLIVCRHTLEHLADPGVLLEPLSSLPGIPVFFDVPSLDWIVHESAFWDIYYEHCNYFSAHSLARLLERFSISIDSIETGFGGQYLMAFGRTGDNHHPACETLQPAGLGLKLAGSVQAWQVQLNEWQKSGKTTLLWGGGSRAVAFLAGVGPKAAAQIEGVVDINPHKQGRYLPGSAHRVLAPDQIRQLNPDHIVVLNPAYRAEIGELLQRLEVGCERVDVNSLSTRTPFP